MPPIRILAVDDDAWLHRVVNSICHARGYEFISASDGKEGLLAAQQSLPDLVLVDVVMPNLDGWAMVRALRTRPDFATVPVIFVTALQSDEDRMKGFRLGADAYLTKPVRVDELQLRIQSALSGRRLIERLRNKLGALPEPRRGKKPTAVEGALEEIGLAPLLFMLEQERKTGALELAHGRAQGTIYMRAGRVVAAQIVGGLVPKRARRGAPAVHHLLTWIDGWFEFTVVPVDVADEIDSSATQLLIDGARLLDEARR